MFELDEWIGEALPPDTFTAEELAGAEFVDYPDYLFRETSGDVFAALATAHGIGPQTLEVLQAVRPDELSDEGKLHALEVMTQYTAYVESLTVEMIGAYAGEEQLEARSGQVEDSAAAHEVAMATKCSVYSADRKIGLSRDLMVRLAATAKLMRMGAVSEQQARHLSEQTRQVPLDIARKVEADVLRFAYRQDMRQFCAAVRRALGRHDPNFAAKAKESRKDCIVDHTPNADGTGDLFIRGPLEITSQLERILDSWATKTKSDLGGTSAQRKVAGLRDLCDQYLGSDDAPRNHGRLPIINLCIDLATLLGLAEHPAEIPGVGLVPADVVKWLLADGAPLRKFIIDGKTGALQDISTDAYVLPPQLAEFLCLRNIKSASPYSNVDSRLADMEHNRPHGNGGTTNYANNTPVDRRWHGPKTRGQLSYKKDPKTGIVTWYSPNGLYCRIDPHDYRLGP